MKITKFEHSCLDIKQDNTRIVVDPSVFSKSFDDFSAIDALVITHVHADHFDPEKVKAIIMANPKVTILTT